MPHHSTSPRNPLDQAFWGLILSICVIMGGGICVLGFGGPDREPTDRVGQAGLAQRAPTVRPGSVDGVERDPRGDGTAPHVARRVNPSSSRKSPGSRQTDDPGVRAPEITQDDNASRGIPIGPLEFDEPGARVLDARPVSANPQFAGIEQRLEKIASNLGALSVMVNNQQFERRSGADQSVEFVREFRHLLETHKVPGPATSPSAEKSSTEVGRARADVAAADGPASAPPQAAEDGADAASAEVVTDPIAVRKSPVARHESLADSDVADSADELSSDEILEPIAEDRDETASEVVEDRRVELVDEPLESLDDSLDDDTGSTERTSQAPALPDSLQSPDQEPGSAGPELSRIISDHDADDSQQKIKALEASDVDGSDDEIAVELP
ncbi:MAG: hypothetical protein EHM42_07150, partial [Planctomycetaceae bacterium]